MTEQDADRLVTRNRFSLPLNLSALAWDWGSRGFSCERERLEPKQSAPERVANEDRLLCVQDGRLEILIEGRRRFEAEPGDEVMLPDGTKYRLENVDSREARWLLGRFRSSGLDLGEQP
ncbi:MAG: cupin domain-containing protein [Alphaproteobacteria bacterium]|nr:cupin domain-containing protein [Alphaproteobacteria bacterium]